MIQHQEFLKFFYTTTEWSAIYIQYKNRNIKNNKEMLSFKKENY